MPSLVPAIISSRLDAPGTMLMLVIRISGIRDQLSARIEPMLAPPSPAAVSRLGGDPQDVEVGQRDWGDRRRGLGGDRAHVGTAELGRGLTAGEVADEEALVDQLDPLRGDTLVVVAEATQRAGDRGVRDDGHLRGA